ncbi:hypothetical protein GCM10009804_31660 [Kribbella hippodromi]|uniref:Uncharacterized protein n=1 Tax=Kribbella hippodromi TaxID=434347 RepID=A0ABN2D8T5_9ACTN
MSDRPEPQQLAQPTYLRVHTYNHLPLPITTSLRYTPNPAPTAYRLGKHFRAPRSPHASALASSPWP